jgi:orotidine-5'-phosphate decarboxylase
MHEERLAGGTVSVKERLIFPLDVPNLDLARQWVRRLRDTVGVFKVGLELYTAEGPSVLEMIRQESEAEIFLDLKFHDIPTTMARATRAANLAGADFLTVHLLAGKEAVKRCVESSEGGLKIIGVTILTSHTRADLMEVGYSPELSRDIPEAARRLDSLAYRSGCYGVVCSGKEITALKEAFPHLRVIVPGVRPEWAAESQDQMRVTTHKEAILAGADYLVVGRPIKEAADPVKAAEKILQEIEEALSLRRV